MTCSHSHLVNLRWCYHCGKEFSCSREWLYGALHFWALEMGDGYDH